jgi:type I restriction enzyme, R subunit
MKIDRMFFEKFEDTVRENDFIAAAVEAGQWDRVIDYVNREVFDKPEEYYTLDKLRKAAAVDRRLTLREILEKVFGLIPRFKSKDELLEEEFAKFVADRVPEEAEAIPAIKTNPLLQGLRHQRPGPRHHRQPHSFTDLATNPSSPPATSKPCPREYRTPR